MSDCCSGAESSCSGGSKSESSLLFLQVADMVSGECVGKITQAIEIGMPGTRVEADLKSKTLVVHGTSNSEDVRTLVSRAGFRASAL